MSAINEMLNAFRQEQGLAPERPWTADEIKTRNGKSVQLFQEYAEARSAREGTDWLTFGEDHGDHADTFKDDRKWQEDQQSRDDAFDSARDAQGHR